MDRSHRAKTIQIDWNLTRESCIDLMTKQQATLDRSSHQGSDRSPPVRESKAPELNPGGDAELLDHEAPEERDGVSYRPWMRSLRPVIERCSMRTMPAGTLAIEPGARTATRSKGGSGSGRGRTIRSCMDVNAARSCSAPRLITLVTMADKWPNSRWLSVSFSKEALSTDQGFALNGYGQPRVCLDRACHSCVSASLIGSLIGQSDSLNGPLKKRSISRRLFRPGSTGRVRTIPLELGDPAWVFPLGFVTTDVARVLNRCSQRITGIAHTVADGRAGLGRCGAGVLRGRWPRCVDVAAGDLTGDAWNDTVTFAAQLSPPTPTESDDPPHGRLVEASIEVQCDHAAVSTPSRSAVCRRMGRAMRLPASMN